MKNLKRKVALALTLALMMTVCFCVPAYAAESSTKLTATVPECTYTFSIPADTDIAYNQTESTIGRVSVSNVQHLGSRVIRVLILTGNYLTSTTNSEDKIYFSVYGTNEAYANGMGNYTETNWADSLGVASEIVCDNDHLSRSLTVKASISENAWRNANPGTYEGSIVFSFSVCDE